MGGCSLVGGGGLVGGGVLVGGGGRWEEVVW